MEDRRDARASGPSPGFGTGRRFTLSKRVALTPPLGWADRPDAAPWPGNSDRLARRLPDSCPPPPPGHARNMHVKTQIFLTPFTGFSFKVASFCNRGAGAIGGDLLPHHIGLETVAPTPTMRPGGGVMVLPQVSRCSRLGLSGASTCHFSPLSKT